MFVTAVAVIVVVMKNKPVLDLDAPVPFAPDNKNPRGSFGAGVLRILQRVFLPHLAVGFGMLVVSVYVGYTVWVAPHAWSSGVQTFLLCVLLIIYGAFAFGYALLAAGVFALYEACSAWEEFIAHLFDLVQQRACAQLENLDEGLAKDQAKVLIRGSVKEVVRNVRKSELSSWPRWLAALCLGGIVLALRSVLVKQILKWSGRTIKVGKIFAGKATLVGAVFLNVRFFALLLLCVVYGAGSAFLVFQGLLWWWGR